MAVPKGNRALTPALARVLSAASRRGVVPGGTAGTFGQVYRCAEQGLLESKHYGGTDHRYELTAKGRGALESGFYVPVSKKDVDAAYAARLARSMGKA